MTAAPAPHRLLAELEQRAAGTGISSVHALFLDEPARAACEARGWLLRRDCQFHWVNRGYADFEDYLASFTADKRKKVRRERRRVEEAGVHFQTRSGAELDTGRARRGSTNCTATPSCATATSRT